MFRNIIIGGGGWYKLGGWKIEHMEIAKNNLGRLTNHAATQVSLKIS